MKVKGLLPIAILAALSLTGCELFNPTSSAQSESSTPSSSEPVSSSESESSESESSSEETQYGVRIANKQTLLADWYKGSSRDLDIELTPEANPQVELRNGNLTITSSDPEVVSVSGLGLSALSDGYSIVTVTYHNVSDEIYLTILDGSAIGRYGAEHAGDLEDPLTNEDALLVAKHANYEGEKYYVVGEIASFYHAPGSRTDGAVSWFLKPAQEGGEKFEVYKCYKEDGTFLTDDDVWVKGTAVAYGSFTSYNGQYETSSAVFVSCEGNKPQPRQTYSATVTEALALAAELADGADSYDYYEVTGYVTVQSGNNYFMTETQGEELVKGTSDEAHGSREYYTNGLEIYFSSPASAEIAAKLLKNAQIKIKMILKNYHGQAENLLAPAVEDIEVLQEGQPWVIPEHTVTVAEALEVINTLGNGETTADLYILNEVFVTEITEAYSSYGNMSFKVADTADGTDTLVVFRAKTDADTAAKVVVGAQVTVKGNLQKYVKNEAVTPELTGAKEITVKDDSGGEDPLPEPVDLISLTDASLLGYSGTNVAYGDGDKKVEGVNFSYVEIGAYGSGLQMRTKNGKTSTIYNTVAFASELKSIELTIFAGKEPQSDQTGTFTIQLGSTDKVEDEEIVIDMVQGQGTYTATVEEAGMTFFHFEKTNSQYSNYVASINLNFVAEEPPAPVELPKPVGNFTGYAVNALDQSNVFVTVALGDELAYVEVGTLGKFQTTYAYDAETGLVTIVDETFGTITATYDVENAKLINGTLEGTFASFIGNNGEMEFTASEHLLNCDGTTDELREVFKIRYGDPWTVDTGNTDRIDAVENGVAGGAMKVRAWKGGRYALNFLNDFAEPITVSNVGFWVYNSGETDVTLRMWGYKAAGFQSNFETGSVTAVAGQWTYVRMGFTSAAIYNFQIADFTNTGTYLVFDNICLF